MKLLPDMNLAPARVGFLQHEGFEESVVRVLRMRDAALDQGAIVSIDKVTSRVRVLPIRRPEIGGA